MSSRIVQTTAATAMLLTSVPIFFAAFVTSCLALFVLMIRGSYLMLEFWMTIVTENVSIPSAMKSKSSRSRPALRIQPQRANVEFRPSSRSRTNSLGDASIKPLSHRSDSHVSLLGTPVNRDFEGVGGWRTPRDDEDQSLWMNMKTRLERAHSSNRHHRRSATGGSLTTPGFMSPEALQPLRTPRARPQTSGSASPQSYFSLPTSRSMVSLHPKRFSGSAVERWEQRQSNRNSAELEREVEEIGLAF